MKKREFSSDSFIQKVDIRDQFFDLSMDLLCVLTAQGSFKDLNPSWEQVLGYELKELKSTLLFDWIHEEDRSASLSSIQKLVRLDTKQASFSNRFRTKKGTYKLLLWNASFHWERNLIYAVVRDMTEQHRIEQLKSEFISTVSHELRTPMTSIQGALAMIQGGMAGKVTAEIKSLVDVAMSSCRRMTALLNDILDVEKIEAGKLALDMKIQELLPLIEQSVRENLFYAEKYKVHFIVSKEIEEAKAKVDSARFLQILDNLLSNAAKFSSAGSKVELFMEQRDNWIRISVKDEGPGIPESFQPKLFTQFSQANGGNAREKGGTGLGLRICKALVEQQGGRIGYTTSSLGTTFYFEFLSAI